ncbi:phosphotransferase family protein [Dictyobacter formicarum]|uniref:Aminoglycoside phosphotransferase domain-containing protein n=1 Tax=Dictyobacter formicarum TaxID=2778368 RepID=A0ABQ3VSL6_9CHLR|nr:aminoglycoside phosphotransferase family protein [Dictyobacter formicarum]GHO88629.1 hypothetical protein KSZ_66350 [Dictyobacter formicarum]
MHGMQGNSRYTLSDQQAEALMGLLDLHGPLQITQVREQNHTYRITCQQQTFYLKLHTKDWYPPDEGQTGYSVRHEVSAWNILARHDLATPEIVLAGFDHNNPLGHAYILTREVPGILMNELLGEASRQEIAQILYTVGNYLRRMHEITFAYPGYLLLEDGPTAPPDEQGWQHFTWTLQARRQVIHQWIQQHQDELTPSLLSQLDGLIQQLPELLAPAYTPPRFTQGDFKIDQIIIAQQDGSWAVAASLDMEVASAGDCISDLVSLCVSLAQVLSPTLRWWEPLFAGYGQEPDFAAFRLRLLGGWYPYQPHIWPGIGENGFAHLLQAQDWQTLFSHSHLPSD